jgi:hypothetical protein
VLTPVQRQISAEKKRDYDWLVARAILNNASVLIYSAPGDRGLSAGYVDGSVKVGISNAVR